MSWWLDLWEPFRWGKHRREAEAARDAQLLQTVREITAAQTEMFAGQLRAVEAVTTATAKQAEGFAQWMELISRQYGEPQVAQMTPAVEAALERQRIAEALESGMPLGATPVEQLHYLMGDAE